jgi:hypothetical protein
VPLPDVALRTAPFALEDLWLLWSQARLYADRLVLTGWSLTGRYRRAVPLEQIDEPEVAEGRLMLILVEEASLHIEEAPLQIRIESPEDWASAITTYRDLRSCGGGARGRTAGQC